MPNQNQPAPGRPLEGYPAHYALPDALNGEGECIGVLHFGPAICEEMIRANVSHCRADFQSVTVIDDKTPDALNAHFLNEVALDLAVLSLVAPKARILLYFTERSERGWLAALGEAIGHGENRGPHQPSVLSISWGWAEQGGRDPHFQWTPSSIAAVEERLAEAAQRGITVCAASGDYGAYTDNGQIGVVYPASSAWVLSCGGTQLSHADRTQEEVWSSRAGASGGGESQFIARPAWQTSLPGAETGHQEWPGRLIPDVAALASGPGWAGQLTVGTSAAAPLWAGLIACANQAIRLRGGIHTVGHFTPRLYDPTSGLRDALNRITTGGNAVTHGRSRYEAGLGWDPCTGWGSPIPEALVAKLANHEAEEK